MDRLKALIPVAARALAPAFFLAMLLGPGAAPLATEAMTGPEASEDVLRPSSTGVRARHGLRGASARQQAHPVRTTIGRSARPAEPRRSRRPPASRRTQKVPPPAFESSASTDH